MLIPRDVARYLASRGFDPAGDEFASNALARRICWSYRGDGDAASKVLTSAFISAVPRLPLRERFGSLQAASTWLEQPRVYTPPGLWVPREITLFTADGVVRADRGYRGENEERIWDRYLYIARDGYLEAGQNAGFLLRGQAYFQFAPIIAWIERFWSLIGAIGEIVEPPDYHVVVSIPEAEGTQLTTFGDGWLSPSDPEFRYRVDVPPACIDPRIQIGRAFEGEPGGAGTWFAERIANAFGFAEPRCFNHENCRGQNGPPGSLPTNHINFP